jgi:hypothetical protein
VRWEISVGLQRILDESTDPREVVRAAWVLIEMDRVNMEDQKHRLESPTDPK